MKAVLALTCALLIGVCLLGVQAMNERQSTQQRAGSQEEARRLWEQAIAAKGGRERLYAVRNMLLIKRSTVQKLETPLDTAADDRELLRQVVAYYHEMAKSSPEQLGYLERRGLCQQEMIARFRLGYANRAVATAGEEHGVVVRCDGEMSASWP